MFGTNYFAEGLEGLDHEQSLQDFKPLFFPFFDAVGEMPFGLFPAFFNSDTVDPFAMLLKPPLDLAGAEGLSQMFPFLMTPPSPTNATAVPTSPPASAGRCVGTLTAEERRAKVEKFLEKRKNRSYKKKISYLCRKKVADTRIRVKGRFVSKIEAEEIQQRSVSN
jgi:hypothetical protein